MLIATMRFHRPDLVRAGTDAVAAGAELARITGLLLRGFGA